MSEIKLIYQDDYEAYGDGLQIEITTKAVELGRILEVFERFIKAIGFTAEGELDFVDYEAHEKEIIDAYNRGYSDGVQEMTDENTPPGEPAYEMDKPKRYRVKSVEEMEKILGQPRGFYFTDGQLVWNIKMWDDCGKEAKPMEEMGGYEYYSAEEWWYIPEWVEEIPE